MLSGDVIAFLKFEEGVQEVFSVAVLPGMRYPDILNDDPIIATSYVLPDAALSDVPRALAA